MTKNSSLWAVVALVLGTFQVVLAHDVYAADALVYRGPGIVSDIVNAL